MEYKWLTTDVMQLKSECYQIPAIFCKSEIWRIFRLIYVEFGFNFRFGKPSFIIRCSPPLTMQK